MGVDPSVVGRSYSPSAVYEVGREKIREFAEAIGDPDPVYRDPAVARLLGHPDVIAPPTFPAVLAIPAGTALIGELGIEVSRVVHGDQSFAYQRPVRAGDRLRSTITVERIRSVADSEVITMRTDLATEDGEPVVTARSTMVAQNPDGIAS